MCSCSKNKKLLGAFGVEAKIVNGWYTIDLCDGYSIRYKDHVSYLVHDNEVYLSTPEELKEWAKESCDVEL